MSALGGKQTQAFADFSEPVIVSFRGLTMGLDIISKVAAAAVTLVTPVAAGSSATWSYEPQPKDGLHKLFYVHEGANHGELYFRCESKSGWVFLSPDISTPRVYLPLRAGSATLNAAVSLSPSEINDGFDLDAAIPAQHQIFDEMSAGVSLHVVDKTYPVKTDAERRTIAFFVDSCKSD